MKMRQNICYLVAGVVSGGLVLGVGGSLATQTMSVIMQSQYSLSIAGKGGTLFTSMVLGLVTGFFYPAVVRHFDVSNGGIGGSLGLVLYTLTILIFPEHMTEQARTQGQWLPISVAVFGLLFLIFGIVLEVLGRELHNISIIRITKSFVQE